MLKVKVADFEGPFDLLLHLIKKHEMDIYNVEIYKITNQYLSHLEEMKVMDLEITSEFIVVAATLIEIKSKKLLPKIKVQEENEEDIEKNLMEKLIEYKKIKGVTGFLSKRYTNTGEVYSKKPEIIEEKAIINNQEDILKNITLIDLYNIYNKVLDNFKLKQNVENIVERRIFVDRYKVEDKMDYIIKLLEKNHVIEFQGLIYESTCKLETVVIFLALLELIKIRLVTVYQDNSFDNILVKRRDVNG